ncbi:cytochrome b5-like heme/steroid binding domain-containing protein [Fusarium solani]|uniref:Cytochrome b5-like heme/steroid binding domain-containing protein n=1 Tax=Fusarium solani TaxID=169388 RepID=A0A9P9GM11_FUSSL|nr:cytochrome b5-like heme/steroid binding domain-containing protein [Fusarium solani]KAH7240444.1 cytochrome b5-like heme/steroid binding domain-containing protein [Fusarium solani]
MATSRSFTLQDVAKHDSANDPYMVIRNKVYDCTSFLKKHPFGHCSGGEEVLLEVAGMDATEAYDEVGHSEDADEILEQLYLGEIVAQATQKVKGLGKKELHTQWSSNFLIIGGLVAFIACVLGYLRLRIE